MSPSPTSVPTVEAAAALPGPVISCYLDRGRSDPLLDSGDWQAERNGLAAAGATEAALRAAEARMALPLPDDVAGQAIFVAPDGSTVGDFGADPPRWDLVRFDSLAYVAPMIEWHQLRVPHLAVAVSAGSTETSTDISTEMSTEILSFPVDGEPGIHPVVGDPEEVARRCRELVGDIGASLVVVAGPEQVARDLFQRLVGVLPTATRIRRHDDEGVPFADAVVREVADLSASITVDLLREFRFHRSHGDAAEGAEAVLTAIASGGFDVLLVHDDPDDPRRCRFGSDPHSIGPEDMLVDERLVHEGRLVDACIRASVLQGKQVRVIPSTGDTGPADDIAVFRREVVADGVVTGI